MNNATKYVIFQHDVCTVRAQQETWVQKAEFSGYDPEGLD